MYVEALCQDFKCNARFDKKDVLSADKVISIFEMSVLMNQQPGMLTRPEVSRPRPRPRPEIKAKVEFK